MVDTAFSVYESLQSYFKNYLRTQPQGHPSSLMSSSKTYLRGKQKYISVGHVLFTAGIGYMIAFYRDGWTDLLHLDLYFLKYK